MFPGFFLHIEKLIKQLYMKEQTMTIFVDYNDFFRIITVLITDDITDRPCGLELGLFFL